MNALALCGKFGLPLVLGCQCTQAGAHVTLKRKVRTDEHEHHQGDRLDAVHLNRLSGQAHAHKEAERTDGGGQESVNRRQSMHVQHERANPHGGQQTDVHLEAWEDVLSGEHQRPLRSERHDDEQGRHHAQMERKQTPGQCLR